MSLVWNVEATISLSFYYFSLPQTKVSAIHFFAFFDFLKKTCFSVENFTLKLVWGSSLNWCGHLFIELCVKIMSSNSVWATPVGKGLQRF